MGTNDNVINKENRVSVAKDASSNSTGCRMQQLDLDRREETLAKQQKIFTDGIVTAEKERDINKTSYTEDVDYLSNALSDSMSKCAECESEINDLHLKLKQAETKSHTDTEVLQLGMDSQVTKLQKKLLSVKHTLALSKSQHEEMYQQLRDETTGSMAPMHQEIRDLRTQLKKSESEVYKLVRKNETNVQTHLEFEKKSASANAAKIDEVFQNLKSRYESNTKNERSAHVAEIDEVSQDLKSRYESNTKKERFAHAAEIDEVSQTLKNQYADTAHRQRVRTQSIIEQNRFNLESSRNESGRLAGIIEGYESKSVSETGTGVECAGVEGIELETLRGMILSSLPTHVKEQDKHTCDGIVDKVLQSMGRV
jgi:hypothetical protein